MNTEIETEVSTEGPTPEPVGEGPLNGKTLTDVQTIDLTGLKCPEPVMMLHVRFRQLQQSEQVRIVTTDPTTLRDIPKFCAYLGHSLLAMRSDEEFYEFLVKNGA